jgi:hypothetical protein
VITIPQALSICLRIPTISNSSALGGLEVYRNMPLGADFSFGNESMV